MRYFYIQDNKLSYLPDLSGLTTIEYFDASDNRFTFEDLEPNIYVLNVYSPQDSICSVDTIYFAAEDTLMLATVTDGLYNVYQWTYNGTDISDNSKYSGTNDSLMIIIHPTIMDTDAFSCNVTNDTVTGLTLYRRSIYLSPTVKVSSIPGVIQCADDSITIGFRSAGILPGNIYTVELSDSLGSFGVPVLIASVGSTDTIGTIKAYIPNTIATGDQYRVRINASNPSMTGIPSAGTISILNRTLSSPLLIGHTPKFIRIQFLTEDQSFHCIFLIYQDEVKIYCKARHPRHNT